MLIRIRISGLRLPVPIAEPKSKQTSGAVGASSLVAIGILLSRITGLIRETVFAHFLGNSAVAGIFRAAFRIPNLLSVLFGEGVLSAAFITVYARLRAREMQQEADDLARSVFGVLATVSAALVLLGVLATPLMINLIAPGFQGEDRLLTIRLVRILFPGAGFLVMSAWCLGILNSHRKFLLSYTAPVAMNATMILALFLSGHALPVAAVEYLAWSCVLGSLLQFLVQVPKVLELLPGFLPSFDVHSEHIRSVIRNFGPVFFSRGVVQISAYVDQMIGSYLGPVAVSTLSYGQTIAVLPVSLFSMSVAAAELPALSSATGTQEEVAAILRRRLQVGLRRIAFFIVPSAVALLLLGDVVAAALLRSGHFKQDDATYVWAALAGSSVGLLATSLGRLYSSAFYALLDTKTPLRYAIVRVALTTLLGLLCALWIPRWLHLDARWSVGGLTASAGIAGWVEFALLRRGLTERIGDVSVASSFVGLLWAVAFGAGATGYALKLLLGFGYPHLLGAVILCVFALIYFGGTALLGVPESITALAGVRRRLG